MEAMSELSNESAGDMQEQRVPYERPRITVLGRMDDLTGSGWLFFSDWAGLCRTWDEDEV